jgi:hypothetical protein
MPAKQKELDVVKQWNKLVDSFMRAEQAWEELRGGLPLPRSFFETLPVGAQKGLASAILRGEFWLGAPVLIDRSRTIGGFETMLVEEEQDEPDQVA